MAHEELSGYAHKCCSKEEGYTEKARYAIQPEVGVMNASARPMDKPSFRGEALGNRQANAARAAGDDGDFARKHFGVG